MNKDGRGWVVRCHEEMNAACTVLVLYLQRGKDLLNRDFSVE